MKFMYCFNAAFLSLFHLEQNALTQYLYFEFNFTWISDSNEAKNNKREFLLLLHEQRSFNARYVDGSANNGHSCEYTCEKSMTYFLSLF